MRLRTGLIFAILILSGCDHHKQVNQAQAEAGNAPVTQTDSDLTGQPPVAQPDQTVTPRATPVALPVTSNDTSLPATSSSLASSSTSASDVTPLPTPATTDTTAASASANPAPDSSTTTSPPPASPTEPMASSAPAPTDSSAMSSTTATSDAPAVVISTPPPVPDDTSAQEQVVVLETSLGRIVIELAPDAAPRTCENFTKLVSSGFYNHTAFHRVIPNFIIQGGDPNSKSDDRSTYGKGDPGYTLPAEIKLKHDIGAVAMARLPDSVNPQRDSNGSQFYICVASCPSLDDSYTVFGHVIKGLDIVDKIANQPRDPRDNPLTRIDMEASLEPKDKALADAPSSP